MTPRPDRLFVRPHVRLPDSSFQQIEALLALHPVSLWLLGNGTVGGQAVPLFACLCLPFQNRMYEPHIRFYRRLKISTKKLNHQESQNLTITNSILLSSAIFSGLLVPRLVRHFLHQSNSKPIKYPSVSHHISASPVPTRSTPIDHLRSEKSFSFTPFYRSRKRHNDLPTKMPFRSSSIQPKLLEYEHALPFSSLFSKPLRKDSLTTCHSTYSNSLNEKNEDELLSQPQSETSWRYRAKRTRVVLVFVVNMAICAALGILLCTVVVWMGRAWGWNRGLVGGREEMENWDD